MSLFAVVVIIICKIPDSMSRRPFTFDRTVRLVIGVIIAILLLLVVNYLRGVLLPFLISWFLAYMIQPFVKWLQYKVGLKNRVLSVVAALVIFVGVFAGLIALLVPLISLEVGKMNVLINNYLSSGATQSIIPEAWQDEIKAFYASLDIKSLLQDPDVQGIIKRVAPQLWNLLGSSVSAIAGLAVFFVCLLYVVFILIDYEKISSGWIHIVPSRYRPLVSGIVSDLENGMNRYFRGQALVALFVGVLFAIGFSITGLPLAIVVGLFIGLLNMVPYLQTLGLIPCLLLGILQSAETGVSYWWVLLGIAIVFVVVQCIEDFVLVPKIMGNVTGLNPAVILLALSIWGALLGMVGMIIALPMTTLIISYYKRLVLHEGDALPFPAEEEEKDGQLQKEQDASSRTEEESE